MANEVATKIREGKILRIFDKVDMVENDTFHIRIAVGTKRSMEVYSNISSVDAGAPVVTMILNAVRPEAPIADPVDAVDKEALGQTVVQTGAGTKREAYGPDETDPTLPDDVEFVITMTGGGAQADFKAWIVLKD